MSRCNATTSINFIVKFHITRSVLRNIKHIEKQPATTLTSLRHNNILHYEKYEKKTRYRKVCNNNIIIIAKLKNPYLQPLIIKFKTIKFSE